MVNYSAHPLDSVFSALSDPIRRAILERLTHGEATVMELAEPFMEDKSLPAISKHLKVLEHAGLITRRRDGREHYLHLTAAPLGEAAGWIDRYRSFWDYQFSALDQYLNEEDSGE